MASDTPRDFILAGPLMERWDKELWFGGVRLGKACVSYHRMPVYMFPDLLEGVSPALRARMQGQSCFNFKRVDPHLLAELDELTKRSVERLHKDEIL